MHVYETLQQNKDICMSTYPNGDEDFVSGEPSALLGSSYYHLQYHIPEYKMMSERPLWIHSNATQKIKIKIMLMPPGSMK